jgi:predicted MFS family arabinose efflux permease
LVPGLVIVPLLLFALRETPLGQREAAGGSWSLAPFDRRFRIYLVAVLVFSLSNSSDAFLLLRAGELGVATPLLPLLWCVFHIVKSAGNALAGRSVNRFGPRAMILTGWCLYAAVYVLFGLATAAWHAWALFLGYAFFYAMTEPAEKTLVASLVASQHRGLAYGWFNFAIGLATLPSSLLFGALYQRYGVLAAFGCGSALAVAAAGILLRVSLPRTSSEESP